MEQLHKHQRGGSPRWVVERRFLPLGTYNNHPPYLHVQKFFFLFLSLLYFHLYIFLFADPVNLLDTAHQNPTNWLAKKKIQRASRVSQCHLQVQIPRKEPTSHKCAGPRTRALHQPREIPRLNTQFLGWPRRGHIDLPNSRALVGAGANGGRRRRRRGGGRVADFGFGLSCPFLARLMVAR
jgi:hypothetical protein